MSVISLEFYILLALTVALLALSPMGARKGILLGASAVFYVSGGATSAIILSLFIGVNYLFLRLIVRADREAHRDRLYLASVLLNLMTFVAFKAIFEPAPNAAVTVWDVFGFSIGYPLGLSFVILMLHSALSDAYSGKYVPDGKFSTFVLFSGLFPYVSSGPVERLESMERQLEQPRAPRVEDLSAGVALIALGLAKKIVAANRMETYVRDVFSGEMQYSAVTVALAIILNAAKIYCDFSGYTDIARGAARCVGIDVRMNFDKPFSARSVTEFWRRWHMSFSTWLRDYIYMPIAYSLRGSSQVGLMIAVMVTFILCGFWHRAAGTFLLFGLLHGAAMALEIVFKMPSSTQNQRSIYWQRPFAHCYTLVFVSLAMVLVTSTDLVQAADIVSRLYTSEVLPWPTDLFAYKGPTMFFLIFIGIAVWQLLEWWHRHLTPGATPWFVFAAALAVLFLGRTDGGGFVYVQF